MDRVTNEAFRGRKKENYFASKTKIRAILKKPPKPMTVERHFQNEKDRHWARELKKWGIVIAFSSDLPCVTTLTKRFLSDTKTASVDHKNSVRCTHR